MIIDCISDLHGYYPKLEGGDLLIIAGDLTHNDSDQAWDEYLMWQAIQKYTKIIFIAGNHDNQLIDYPFLKETFSTEFSISYLCDSGTEFEGLKIWGSPWTRNFKGQNPHWKAFGLDTEEELKDKFDLIPFNTDILITHSPPKHEFDETDHGSVGSISLRNMIYDRIRLPNLKLNVFGHVHECGGQSVNRNIGVTFVNASIMNEVYNPIQKSVRVIL